MENGLLWSQPKHQCVYGIPGKLQVKFVPPVKSRSSLSFPFPGLPNESLLLPFQKAAAFPAWMPSPRSADVYQSHVGDAWPQNKPAACRKAKACVPWAPGTSTRAVGRQALCEQFQVHVIGFHDTHRLPGKKLQMEENIVWA